MQYAKDAKDEHCPVRRGGAVTFYASYSSQNKSSSLMCFQVWSNIVAKGNGKGKKDTPSAQQASDVWWQRTTEPGCKWYFCGESLL